MLLRYIQSLEVRQKILLACHIDSTSGHMGKTRTLYRIKERFMWHGMVKDVVSLVSSLFNCISGTPLVFYITNSILVLLYFCSYQNVMCVNT